MAKKRKASGRSQPTGPKEVDEKDARLGPITTYEDVADSEDEYFLNRDRIMFDEPSSKRRRQDDDEYEFSDEEVFARDDDSDDEAATKKASAKSGSKGRKAADSEDEAEGDEEEEEDTGYWGSSKGDYYNADNIETEADALAEEAEAKRLQQKKLSKMAEEDFIFDEDEWMKPEPEKEDDDEVVTEVLKDVEITDDMGPEERCRLLKARYPEFEHLAKEFEQLQPSLLSLKDAAAGQPAKSLAAIKYWVLGCYVASLASYFAILTSPARDAAKETKPLSPADLRDHEVMETLIECRDAWQRIQHMKSTVTEEESDDSIPDVEAIMAAEVPVVKTKKSKKAAKADALAEQKRQRKLEKKLEQARAAEASVADLYDLPLGSTKSKKRRREETTEDAADNSDFGEEDALDERTAAEKAARKKSLKFYTSQIVQKANRRAGAGRDAGGDADLPYRERFRDRQARLLAAAEKRGQKDSKHGADLGDDSDEDDSKVANAMRDDEDDYYDMVANSAAKKREEKAARAAALANAGKADRVVENEVIGEDGKRKVTYAIEKNKGLAPKRSKDVRNPRVKKRKQYEAKQKKLRSMKPMWKGGEPVGGYQGERTGVNINVIKSTKL
jgi:U3 small nucleolar RNA-associated protein 3